jgi:hypothetical protein
MTGTIRAQIRTHRGTRTAIQLALGLAFLGGAVQAETIVTDDQVIVRESNVERPGRGMTMKAVEAKFGAPLERHSAVGKPPITRWDYSGFAVFFEYEHVIDAVVNTAS